MDDTEGKTPGQMKRVPHDEELRLLAELRAAVGDTKRSKALQAQLFRFWLFCTPEGVDRMYSEALIGDGYQDAMDRAVGKAPQVVDLEGAGAAVLLPLDLDPAVVAVLAAVARAQAVAVRAEEAKVDAVDAELVEDGAPLGLSAASDNGQNVNSDHVEKPARRRAI